MQPNEIQFDNIVSIEYGTDIVCSKLKKHSQWRNQAFTTTLSEIIKMDVIAVSLAVCYTKSIHNQRP